jgi:hypothetical protein
MENDRYRGMNAARGEEKRSFEKNPPEEWKERTVKELT